MILSAVVLSACMNCGTERWPVKTLSDRAAVRLVYKPVQTTVSSLVQLVPPYRPVDRVAPTEFTLYQLTGCVRLLKGEADNDYHLVVTDPTNPAIHMIAEIPNPTCIGVCTDVVNKAKYAAARDLMDHAQVPFLAEITGFGFFDKKHGQTGLAPNGVELHPVLRITPKGACL